MGMRYAIAVAVGFAIVYWCGFTSGREEGRRAEWLRWMEREHARAATIAEEVHGRLDSVRGGLDEMQAIIDRGMAREADVRGAIADIRKLAADAEAEADTP